MRAPLPDTCSQSPSHFSTSRITSKASSRPSKSRKTESNPFDSGCSNTSASKRPNLSSIQARSTSSAPAAESRCGVNSCTGTRIRSGEPESPANGPHNSFSNCLLRTVLPDPASASKTNRSEALRRLAISRAVVVCPLMLILRWILPFSTQTTSLETGSTKVPSEAPMRYTVLTSPRTRWRTPSNPMCSSINFSIIFLSCGIVASAFSGCTCRSPSIMLLPSLVKDACLFTTPAGVAKSIGILLSTARTSSHKHHILSSGELSSSITKSTRSQLSWLSAWANGLSSMVSGRLTSGWYRAKLHTQYLADHGSFGKHVNACFSTVRTNFPNSVVQLWDTNAAINCGGSNSLYEHFC
mmetsp:Transcript_92744/g.212439  ORF Transcript_92744/g.212439 Transcript_92744/m.212439 type:complete len:354 (-) Transcript_92744:804-1865(-)